MQTLTTAIGRLCTVSITSPKINYFSGEVHEFVPSQYEVEISLNSGANDWVKLTLTPEQYAKLECLLVARDPKPSATGLQPPVEFKIIIEMGDEGT